MRSNRLLRVSTVGRTALVAMVTLLAIVGPTILSDAGGIEAVQPAQDEFVPLESVPPEDQLPAAPLLVAAYALLWVSVLGYLWSIWRRMMNVERELVELSRRTGES